MAGKPFRMKDRSEIFISLVSLARVDLRPLQLI
jgi:hypothetical protein